MAFLTPSYDVWGVVASVLIGAFASYVALDLVKRVRSEDRVVSLTWWACGSLVLGTGVWSMHFVGMLAFSLPIALGYTGFLTFLSWLEAVGVCAIALSLATHGTLTPRRLAVGSFIMGLGICAMHYIGMAALDMTPAIVWNLWLIAASAAIAVAASAAALLIFFWLRSAPPERAGVLQLLAASVMGAAISGMHYTAMAAANFPEGSLCLSAGELGGQSLGALVMVLSATLLAVTLFASVFDARRRLAMSLDRANANLQTANEELQSANDELQKRAFLDPLTGMPNRVLFEDRLAHAVARYDRHHGTNMTGKLQKIAVLFVNVDAFKAINDSLGHAAGDQVLVEVGARLRRLARTTDTVARLGVDEFVLLMEDMATEGDCVQFVNRALRTLSAPLALDAQKKGAPPLELSASVGIALYPDHGDRDELLLHADAAMHAAKRAGGGGFTVFQPHMDSGARDMLALQHELRHAIERGEMQLYYQPKIHGRGSRLSGVEALVRWNHPQRGMVSPAVFVAVAERVGLIRPLGDWVISEACRQMRVWLDAGLRVPVAVNLSAHQLREPDLVSRISAALERNNLEPSQLLCEITESAAMEDIDATQRLFADMERLGIFLSIDDFGTGYSSLAYLRQLPAQQLKIDRSFVTDLETNTDARAVVDAVINLAHALDLRVVAEGVETDGQREILRRLDCDELQGYLFAKPMPADALPAWMEQHRIASSVVKLRQEAMAG